MKTKRNPRYKQARNTELEIDPSKTADLKESLTHAVSIRPMLVYVDCTTHKNRIAPAQGQIQVVLREPAPPCMIAWGNMRAI
jgi:hypothetical protein